MEEQEKEGEEYQVEDIVTHLEYVEAFELRGYIAFNPDSGHGLTHSKYVYLVKWLGYDDEANTWEPEENLVDCTEVLSIYKRKHGLPLYHETFSRQFNWIEPTTSLTKEEVNRLAFKNRDHDQITSASQLVRDPPTKKKRRDKETLQDFVVESDDDAVEYPPPKRKKVYRMFVSISTIPTKDYRNRMTFSAFTKRTCQDGAER
ncbi:Chromo' (CHRromatin Organization MOdifier) domain protein, partial [Trichostrongylus colubriformis]